MHYLALATDYDGTLAADGHVSEETLAALKRLQESGRKLILVTGRELDSLRLDFSELDWFDVVVAENGAVVYYPGSREEQLLGDRPPEAFMEMLHKYQVKPLSVGRVIVATWEPNETKVLNAIRDLGLELQVIFNKGAVMILPSGINKAAGLKAALEKLGLSAHNVVGVGDAENDHAFLDLCDFSVAVANALPMVKEKADWVTNGCRGVGVTELIDELQASDLANWKTQSNRHNILLGTKEDQTTFQLCPYGSSLLLAGTSGAGKSTLATAIIERLGEQGYQFCIIDPEGDYENLEGAVVLGDSHQTPRIDEILDLLKQPNQNIVVNLLGIKLEDRPSFFAQFLPSLLKMRSLYGRPHWLIVDEAHHLLPSSWEQASLTLPQTLDGLMLITVHPNHVAVPALSLINTFIAVGKEPKQTLESFCQAVGEGVPTVDFKALEQGEALVWQRKTQEPPFRFEILPPRSDRHRHRRKYAEGELASDRCFYFRGPQQKLNLRAQNLIVFTQLAFGVDDETWLYHFHQEDYSRWFRDSITDEVLAEDAAQIEQTPHLSANESRELIRAAIERRYTLPI